ncbi:hypothetical protein ACB092_M009600 [Castanea dentata]
MMKKMLRVGTWKWQGEDSGSTNGKEVCSGSSKSSNSWLFRTRLTTNHPQDFTFKEFEVHIFGKMNKDSHRALEAWISLEISIYDVDTHEMYPLNLSKKYNQLVMIWKKQEKSYLFDESFSFSFHHKSYQALQDRPTPSATPLPPQWTPPVSGVFKANVDGAVFKDISSAVIGVILWDDKGNVIGALSQRIYAPLRPLEAEAKAMEAAMLFARDMGNKPAHLLVQHAKYVSDFKAWVEETPSFIEAAIASDISDCK